MTLGSAAAAHDRLKNRSTMLVITIVSVGWYRRKRHRIAVQRSVRWNGYEDMCKKPDGMVLKSSHPATTCVTVAI